MPLGSIVTNGRFSLPFSAMWYYITHVNEISAQACPCGAWPVGGSRYAEAPCAVGQGPWLVGQLYAISQLLGCMWFLTRTASGHPGPEVPQTHGETSLLPS